MDTAIERHLTYLKNQPDVLGVILFGSWARGDYRDESDVDLLVIKEDGFKRTVEYRNGKAFEITYTTPDAAEQYWESNKDDCANLWDVARILYDKDGTIKKLKRNAHAILDAGKLPLDTIQLEHLEFDAKDQIRAAEELAERDPATAVMLLHKVVLSLTGLFFDMRQLWIPAPKQRLANIKQQDPQLYQLLCDFYDYGKDASLVHKISTAQTMVNHIFKS